MTSPYLPVGKAATFREVLPRSIGMAQPPRFAFGTFPADVATQYYSNMHLAPVGIYAGAGFELADGFILRKDGELIVAPDLKIFPKHLSDIEPAREATYKDRRRRRVPGSTAIVISPGYTIYGHWLAEILPRLAVLVAAGEHLEKLTFAVPADTPQFGLDLLGLFGVPESQILVYGADEVLQPDELLMPTLMHNGVRYAPLLADAVALFQRGVVKAGHSLTSPNAPARIFLARSRGNRRLMNREKIEMMAEAAGFTIVKPETMSLPDQIALFGSVREITGEYGSAFHTALFSPPGTVICGLRGSQGHPGFLQSAMGEVLGQPTGYCFGQGGTGPQPGDYTMPEQAFADCLRLAFSANANLSTCSAPQPARPAPEAEPGPAQEAADAGRGFWSKFRRRQPPFATSPMRPGSLLETLLPDRKK